MSFLIENLIEKHYNNSISHTAVFSPFFLLHNLKIMLSIYTRLYARPTEKNVFPTLVQEWTHTSFFRELHAPRCLTQLSVLQNYHC